jgi:myo-inositol 2-dehydrogenase/D-chiro-inositol 1-dehydrogenase
MRVAVLGCGQIGRMYLEHLRQSGYDDVVCYDTVPEQAETANGRVARTVEEVLALAPDAALVTSATAAHADLVSVLLSRRIPTFCEKPLTLDLKSTAEIGPLAEHTATMLWVGFHRRFDRDYAEIHQRARTGELGEIRQLRLFSHDAACPPLERLKVSGSIFCDLMLHDFDALRWLTGEEIEEISAWGSVLTTPGLRELNDFDHVAATARMSGGALAVLTAGRTQPLGYDVRLEVLAAHDSLAAGRTPRSPLRGPADPAPPEAPYRDYRDRFESAYRDQLIAFLRAVSGRGVDERAGRWQDSYYALRAALAAERSARRGGIPVRLDDRSGWIRRIAGHAVPRPVGRTHFSRRAAS